VSNCTFLNNTTTSASARRRYPKPWLGGLTVSNSTFSATRSRRLWRRYCKLYRADGRNSTFSGNSAGVNGGAIWNIGTATVSYSTFSGNSASSGGGIYEYEYGTLTLKSTLLAAQPAAETVYSAAGRP